MKLNTLIIIKRLALKPVVIWVIFIHLKSVTCVGRSITDHFYVISALFCSLHLLKERIESIKNLLNMNYGCCDDYNGDHRIEHILKD